MKTNLFIFFIILLTATKVVDANQFYIHNGFGTGRDYIEMTQSEKRVYAMGVINGILLAPLFHAPKDEMIWFESYIENMTDMQLAAILSKYLENNPGRWHDGLHILMYSAIKEAFDKSRSKGKK